MKNPAGTKATTAVVTGGSAGIGAAICYALLDAGHQVVVLDSQPLAWKHERAHHVSVDLSDTEATRAAASKVASQFAVTILVHNAGVIRPALADVADPDDLKFCASLHLVAPLVLLQAFVPAMRTQNFGRVILISSRALLGLPTRTSYAATKAGMIGLGRTWALEFAKHGLTVNTIAPGPIGSTDMFRQNTPEGSEQETRLRQAIPVGRLGRPEDVANAALFFASPNSAFITGQTLFVCGGASVGSLAF